MVSGTGGNGTPRHEIATLEFEGEKYALISDVIGWLLGAGDAIEQTESKTPAAQALQVQLCREIAKRLGLSLLD